MAVKVFIFRRVPAKVAENVKPLLFRLRGLAREQPGYISGETLVNVDDHEAFVVLSTWNSFDDWQVWQSDPIRSEIEESVETLLGAPARYEAYYSG